MARHWLSTILRNQARALASSRRLGNARHALTADVNNTGYYPYGVDVAFRLWGDDEWYDDLLYTVPGTTYSYYSPYNNTSWNWVTPSTTYSSYYTTPYTTLDGATLTYPTTTYYSPVYNYNYRGRRWWR